ncbi:MAG: hypothetical protein ACRC16_18625, partial [Aeromonas salmonicida]
GCERLEHPGGHIFVHLKPLNPRNGFNYTRIVEMINMPALSLHSVFGIFPVAGSPDDFVNAWPLLARQG